MQFIPPLFDTIELFCIVVHCFVWGWGEFSHMLRRCFLIFFLEDMDMMAFQIMSILFDDTGPALTWYQIDANIHSSFTGKIFILVISTRWLWFPSLCTGYVKLVLVGQPQTPSLRFHLPKVAGLTLRKFPPWCRHAGIP